MDEKGALLHPTSMSDALVNAEVLLPQGGYMRLARVIRRSVDSDGKVVGNHNDIPILNTILYDVDFPDGAVKPYSANKIAENIRNQVDEDGYHNQIINTILEHSNNSQSLYKKDKWIFTKRGRQSMRKNYCGMEILC